MEVWYRQTETTRYQMPSAVTRSHMPAEPSTSGTATIDGCCAPTPYRRGCCRTLPTHQTVPYQRRRRTLLSCSADSQGSQISRAHTGPKRRQQGRERLQRPAAGVALNSRGQKRCRQCPRVARAPRPPTPSYACLELPEVTCLVTAFAGKARQNSWGHVDSDSAGCQSTWRCTLPSAPPSTVRAVRLRG